MKEIWLSLHNIRSTHNIGSIFRTAEGLGVKKILLSGYTPYPKIPGDKRLPHIYEKLTKQIHKTALGAEELVEFSYFEDFTQVLKEAKRANLQIIALEQAKNSQNLVDFKYEKPLLLVLGEEVDGIDQAVLKTTDMTLEIPMVGKKESFNVSVAAGLALYQIILK